jgi:protocatechuate 3,4-dioxygenase beta subunit
VTAPKARSARRAATPVLAAAVAAGFLLAAGPEREPIVGLPCEGCEWVFEGMPAEPANVARIAPAGERGEPMRIEGTVRDAAGNARAGVVVYAYHTDDAGFYPRGIVRHGRLRGWAKTDSEGRYRFDSIRPAGYPGTDIPAHVHMHVVEPGRCAYYLDDIEFIDDPRLAPSLARQPRPGRGGPGVATPERVADGWRVVRDIELGRMIPGYEACGRGPGGDRGGERR